jgi:superfamily I DNA/RNA helicase
VASLDRFLAWFGQGEVEVKRDPWRAVQRGSSDDRPRLKGLEAPLVILADATHDPDKVGGTSSVLEVPWPGVGKIPIIRTAQRGMRPDLPCLDRPGQGFWPEEHWRLAYVGLTRAAERLVIAGVKPSATCLHTVGMVRLRRHCKASARPLSKSRVGVRTRLGGQGRRHASRKGRQSRFGATRHSRISS